MLAISPKTVVSVRVFAPSKLIVSELRKKFSFYFVDICAILKSVLDNS
jgi:CRISPR/Cas system Type II protein with McrA/HNH and RuvC-like nuclease domain